jgi:endonuclease/exonuclease/phosphatase (EEP) superfamily protein YafD
MPEDLPGDLALLSLNTRGIAPIGSRLAGRYAAIGRALEAGDAEVAALQEVFTWWHLRLLARGLRSLRHVSFRPSPAGPAGGLGASRKGALVTRLARPGLCVISTHLAASRDGDWSPASRLYPLHRAQLAAFARLVRGAAGPAVVCGDFNVARDSALFSAVHRFHPDRRRGQRDRRHGGVRRPAAAARRPRLRPPALSTQLCDRYQAWKSKPGSSSA